MAAEAYGDEAATSSKRPLTFLDLPLETQHEVLNHCTQSDLICCALVSKHFHELASTQLYRSFCILFPDDDDIRFEYPIDGLAGGLDTFTTSDYNYAKHLRELSMDTVSAGPKGEHSYKPYLYSASCGKFLNTLLHLTLKKAKGLESFRWNVRVELNRPVYQELHRIRTLTRFHIRMQAGETYYARPPPLPLSFDDLPVPGHWIDIPSPPPPVVAPSAFVAPGTGTFSTGPSLMPPMGKFPSRTRSGKRGSTTQEPPTLSGFQQLKSLSVLDIDNLDLVAELKACVRNSTSTLTELYLSFSDNLALQARRPSPDSDLDDSDPDDEFQVVPASQSSNFDANGPAKVFRSQEERILQEAVLGKVFDVEPFIAKKSQLHQNPREVAYAEGNGQAAERTGDTSDPRHEFVSSLKNVSMRLMSHINGTRHFSSAQQEILDVIEKAAKKYVDSFEITAHRPDSPSGVNSPETKDGQEQQEYGNDELHEANVTNSSDSNGKTRSKSNMEDSSPEDIEIEHMHTVEDLDDETDDQPTQRSEGERSEAQKAPISTEAAEPNSSNQSPTPVPDLTSEANSDMTTPRAQQANNETTRSRLGPFQVELDAFAQQLAQMRAERENVDLDQVHETEAQVQELARRIVDIHGREKMAEDEMQVARRSMDDYIRATRGIALETLAIQLVPVKASVLSRAIDLRCIRSLTLLNVGNQTPIWTLFTKENKTAPLALRSVFTDSVSTSFLTCLSQLDELHDLFMLERNAKYKPESFAPRTTVTIDQIRRLVLKKHMLTLKRLMIKDETNSTSWDANQKAMILICNRGVQLEELAISMNIYAVHAFMQYFAGLINLRAINILRFRNNDTCIWVMREILNFIVDILSHHSELKLEWIAMEDDRLDRVIRPVESNEDEAKRKGKGKAKATATSGQPVDGLPVMPSWSSDSESDDEEGDDLSSCGKRLRLKTVGVLQFYDVWGVKIFEKEIRNGRL